MTQLVYAFPAGEIKLVEVDLTVAGGGDASMQPDEGYRWLVLAMGFNMGTLAATRSGLVYLYDGTTTWRLTPDESLGSDALVQVDMSEIKGLVVNRSYYLRFNTNMTGADADSKGWALVLEIGDFW